MAVFGLFFLLIILGGFCMKRKNYFTEETKSLILDMEKKLKKEEKHTRNISEEQLDFIDILIKRYDEVFGTIFDYTKYRTVCIYGQSYYILPEMSREIKAVVDAINANAFDNRAVYKRYEENGTFKRQKTYKPYRIQRLVRMLKVSKEANYTLFENFVKIPDVSYALNAIKNDRFGQLDVYMGAKSG